MLLSLRRGRRADNYGSRSACTHRSNGDLRDGSGLRDVLKPPGQRGREKEVKEAEIERNEHRDGHYEDSVLNRLSACRPSDMMQL